MELDTTRPHAEQVRGRPAYHHLTETGPARRHLLHEHSELPEQPHGQDSDWYVSEVHARAHGVLLAPSPEVDPEPALQPFGVVRDAARAFTAAVRRGEEADRTTPTALLDAALDHITALLDADGHDKTEVRLAEPDIDDYAEQVRGATERYADARSELDAAIDRLSEARR